MALLDELHKGGATICMVTHDARYAELAQRKIRMFDGRVVDEETMHRLRHEEEQRLLRPLASAPPRARGRWCFAMSRRLRQSRGAVVMSWIAGPRFALRSLRSQRRHGGVRGDHARTRHGCGDCDLCGHRCRSAARTSLPERRSHSCRSSELANDGHTMRFAQPNYADLIASRSRSGLRGVLRLIQRHRYQRRQHAARDDSYAGGDFFRMFGVGAAARPHASMQGRRNMSPSFRTRSGRACCTAATTCSAAACDRRRTGDGHRRDAARFRLSRTGLDLEAVSRTIRGSSRSAHNWSVVARLRDAAALGDGGLAAATLAARLSRAVRRCRPMQPRSSSCRCAMRSPRRYASALLLLAAGTAFLLLIAVTNATNLLLALNASRTRRARRARRARCQRPRIARQIFLEGLLIAVAASAAALGRRHRRDPLAHARRRCPSCRAAAKSHLAQARRARSSRRAVDRSRHHGLPCCWSRRRRSTTLALRESARGQSPGVPSSPCAQRCWSARPR